MFKLCYWLVLSLTIALGPSLDAQVPTPLAATTVTLVAGPKPSKGGRTEVIRQAHRHPKNVVVVDKNANADDLAAALATINALRVQDGDNLTSDYRARTERVRLGPKWAGSEYRKWLTDQLHRLKKAGYSELDELGRVQAVKITLPAPKK